MTRQRDIWSGAGLLALAALYVAGATDLPPGQGEPGPAFFPVLLAAALAVIAAAMLARAAVSATARRPDPDDEPRPGWRKPLVAAGMTAAYVALFPVAGFAAATWLYAFAIAVFLRRARLGGALVLSVVSTLLIYVLFALGLGVSLPAGMFG